MRLLLHHKRVRLKPRREPWLSTLEGALRRRHEAIADLLLEREDAVHAITEQALKLAVRQERGRLLRLLLDKLQDDAEGHVYRRMTKLALH